ncbi:hypothetical protein KPL70_014312 [Citrus sinensis]|nr:hypothetical protein KPL70_014312 [Citrus sinensis]
MKALLVHQGLDEALAEVTSSKKSRKISEDDLPDVLDRAHSAIILSLGDGVLREVGGETTAAGLWKKLEHLYNKKSMVKRLPTKKKLYTLQMDEGSSISYHIDAFNKIILDFEDINVKIDDEDKAMIMLCSLPSSYEHLVDTLMYGRQFLSMVDVKETLSSKAATKKEASHGEGLIIRGRLEKTEEGQESDGYDSAGVLIVSDGASRGHMSERDLRELSKQRVLGEDKLEPLEFCEECVLGKSSRVKFSTGAHVSRGTLEYIHADLWGSAQTASLGGARKVKKLRTDNDLEFCNKRFKDFCSKHGVMRHRTVRYTPQQNGLDERMNRSLVDKVRCMLIHSKLPMSLWAEALSTACHIVNISPSTGINFKTPYELWYGKPADYSSLKIFGCPAYAHIKQGKLEPRALKCVFLGYPEGVKGYKLWCTDMKPPKAIISRDVIFNEAEMLQHLVSLKTTNAELEDKDERSYLEVELSNSNQKQKTRSKAGDVTDMEIHDTENETTSDQGRSEDYQLVRDREKRVIRPPRRFAYADLIAFALTAAHEIATNEPRTYSEAINSDKAEEWIKVMDEEMMSLKKNHTWNLIERPVNKRVIECKWIYKIKEGIPELSHKDTKPVVVQDMHLEQMDVKIAFLHGEIDEMIVMSQPERYEDPEKVDHVCHLKKSLYGLKQSPRLWYLRFNRFMSDHGFQRSSFDCCVYFKTIEGGDKIYLLLYVDDMLIACKEMKFINELKQQLSNSFEMKDLGAAKKILGVQLKRDRKNVSVVSRYMANPGKDHWKVVVWILKYLAGTTDYGLIYGAEKYAEVSVEGYVDAYYAGDLDKIRSLTGFLFMLNGCTINWKASLQSVVALSTTEAEYTAAAEAIKEAIWLRGMVTELGFEQKQITVHCDSQSAICLSKNQIHHEKTKHIDIKLHFVRLEISKGVIKLAKIHTDSNIADMLTKAVPGAKFEFCLNSANICKV